MRSHRGIGAAFQAVVVSALVAGIPIEAASDDKTTSKETETGQVSKQTESPQASSREKVRVYTNADLEALGPLPTQAAPIADSGGWDFVFAVMDRERELEERRRERDLAAAALARRPEAERPRYYLPLFPCYPGFCPLDRRDPPFLTPQPSNPFLSLESRGIRTAADLYRESVRDSRIRRRSFP